MENSIYKIQWRLYNSTGDLIHIYHLTVDEKGWPRLGDCISTILSMTLHLFKGGKYHDCTAIRTNITVRDATGKLVPWKHLL